MAILSIDFIDRLGTKVKYRPLIQKLQQILCFNAIYISQHLYTNN